MRFNNAILSVFCSLVGARVCEGFSPSSFSGVRQSTALRAIGLGPDAEEVIEAVPADDDEIEEPDHELFRDTRLSKFDKQCDDWFGTILHQDQPSFLGKVSEEALLRINTLPKLERAVRQANTSNVYLVLLYYKYSFSQ